MASSRAVVVLLALSAAISVAAAPPTSSGSSAEAVWGEPVLVFSTTGFVSNPALLADPSGDVHLFFAATPEADPTTAADGAVLYVLLHQGRWNTPAEVLTTPGWGAPKQPTAVLDPWGFLHVVWKGGIGNSLFYSRARASEASSPGAWTPPIVVSEELVAPAGFGLPSALAATPDGRLHLVYASTDRTLRYRYSSDGGRTWTPGIALFEPTLPVDAPDLPRLASDESGRLYLAWTQFQRPSGWPPTGAFFSRSTDGGRTWSPPTRVAGPNYGLVSVVVGAPDVVHLVWNSVAAIGERGHRRSENGGESLAAAEMVAPDLGGGFTGFPGIGVDSAGVLHLATVGNAFGGLVGGVYHLQWDGSAWSQPEFLSKGATGKRSVEQPTLAITLGSRLHVAYEDDFQRIWYVGGLAAAPAAAPRVAGPPALTPTPGAAGPSLTAIASPTEAPTAATSAPAITEAPSPSATSPAMAMLVAVASTSLLLAAAVAYGVSRHAG